MRILLVEDEQRLADSLKHGLEQSGYVVDHFAEGLPAVDRLSLYRNEYDIVILDLMLPDIDGHTICKTVRGLGVTLPILILTARGETEDKVLLLQSGADDYMVKPFAFSELLARLQALLRRPDETVPNVLSVGQFTLNTATHTIFRFEEKLPLTLKEFMLLEYFMRHPNQVIVRDDIIDHAWNFDFSSLSNTVDVHVKNLRKKIGTDENKSSKQFEGSATSLWGKYRTDLFFRTTCHIIVLQVVFTVIVVIALWFVMDLLMRDTTEALMSTFTQMLQGQSVTPDNVRSSIEDVRTNHFLPTMVISTALMLCFGFIIVYVALTPTRRSMERQKRFISNIAHELRTPLAVIQTNTDVALLNSDVPARLRQTLQNNSQEISRISEIMNNLLSLSNFMRNEQLKFEDVDLSVVVQRVLDTLEETSNHKDITLALKTHTNQAVLGKALALNKLVLIWLKMPSLTRRLVA